MPYNPEELFAGSGVMAALMREKDWSATALGPASQWPQSLRTAVSICLESRFPMFIWWGRDMIMLYNDAYGTILGAKHPQALGRPGRVVWPEIWDVIGPMLDGVLYEGRATWSENQCLVLHRHGYAEESYFTFSYSPIRDESGGIGGIFTAVYETTEQVLAARRLVTLRDLAARAAVATSTEEAYRSTIAVLAQNDRDVPFAHLLVRDHDQLQVAATTTGANSIGGDVTARIRRAAAAGVAPLPASELGQLSGDGATDDVVILPLTAPAAGEPYGFLVAGVSRQRALDAEYRSFFELVAGHIVTGIANARAREDEQRRLDALAELDRAKTAFFSNVSHEFRTPLTLMLGPLEEMLDDGGPEMTQAIRDQLAPIHRQALRLLKLVNTLLDFSRIEAGRARARYVPTDVAAFTADLASMFRPVTDKAGLKLTIDAPPLDTPVYVDRDMWEKIVLNLLSNAFKFTLQGEITARVRRDGQSVQLIVGDTGSGIPAAELPHLFTRFHRIEGTRRRTHEGTGIGLALVQELTELHGGSIEVKSAEGKGTEFTVSIPLGADHLAADQVERAVSATGTPSAAPRLYVEEAMQWLPHEEPAESAARAVAPADQPKPHILLVDDNGDLRAYVRRLLEPQYAVTTFADGAMALEAAAALKPDLVLSDVMMPNMDGFELLHALRSRPATAGVPIILLSARAGEEARVEGLAAGADDYIVKPFSARELQTRVSGLLALSRVRREASAAMREVFMLAPAFTATLRGPRHVFEVANPMYMQLIGERDIIGKSVREVFPDLEGQQFFELLDTVYATGEPFVGNEIHVHLRERDGRMGERYLDFIYQPLRSPRGEVEGIFVHGVDVTEKVLVRQQAERQAAELERVNRAKDDFLATLSHELRTPLTAILGWSHMLRLGVTDEETTRVAIDTIDRSAQIQAQLIDDVLDLSRIVTGKVRIDAALVDVGDVAAKAVDGVRLAAAARGVILETDLLDGSEPPHVLGDAGRLQQVIWNLLTNAIKFTPQDGRISIAVRRFGSSVRITVTDSGIGIAPEFLPYVFEPFRQAESTTTRVHGGLGLGLAIVRHMVQLHGGTITAFSEGEGRGAKFTIDLPLARSTAATGHMLKTDAMMRDLVDHEFADLNGTSVLVIDDDASVSEVLASILRHCGARVETAASVKLGIRAIEREVPDVIVCDIAMPNEDGFDFARWLATSRAANTVPLVAVTAFGRPEDERRTLAAGFARYVRKPIDPATLSRTIAGLTRRVPPAGGMTTDLPAS